MVPVIDLMAGTLAGMDVELSVKHHIGKGNAIGSAVRIHRGQHAVFACFEDIDRLFQGELTLGHLHGVGLGHQQLLRSFLGSIVPVDN
jgi:hypothetical protein